MENSFPIQVEKFTENLVGAITALSPLLMVIIILGIAGAGALVEYKFQAGIWGPDLAVIPAVLVGGFRFASGMGGINQIKKRRYIVGIAFVVVSLMLTLWASYHSNVIAAEISPDKVVQGAMTVKVILWSGLAGELMLAALVWRSSAEGKKRPVKQPANGQLV